MDEGWVYLLVNSSIPGLVKVGRTSRAPEDRAAELSGVTGVATPFIVAYEQFFRDCHLAERTIHGALDALGCRVAPNREFFRAAPSDIIRLLLETGDAAGEAASAASASRRLAHTEAALLEAGDSALHGLGEALQDTGEAVRCYKLAMARGSAAACERLGEIYLRLHARKRDRASLRRAMAPLKLGAKRGNSYCYVTMSELFAISGHHANFLKAWHLFFSKVSREAEMADRFAQACCRYLGLCLDLGLAPQHSAALRSASDAIVCRMLAELERGQADPAKRRRAAACLRSAYSLLMPPEIGGQPAGSQPAPGSRRWLPVAPRPTQLSLPAR